MNRKVLIAVGVVALIAVSGCLSATSEGDVRTDESSIVVTGDAEAEVVCFLSSTVVDSGIDCMPLSETEFTTMTDVPNEGSVSRVIQEDAGVVCYRSSTVVDAGVECLPVEETALSR